MAPGRVARVARDVRSPNGGRGILLAPRHQGDTMSMGTGLALLAGGVTLLAGYMGHGRTRTFGLLALYAAIAGSLVLLATPTPSGYDAHVMSVRFGAPQMALYGQRFAGMLFAICAASLFHLGGFHRPEHDESDHVAS
jgi:hypothetical protein